MRDALEKAEMWGGNAWDAPCTAVYRVESGRIAEAWVNWDLLALMEQVGAVERVQTVSA